jgi:hypothetical protein
MFRKLEARLGGRGTLKPARAHVPGGWAIGREFARCKLGVALMPELSLTHDDHQDFVIRRLDNTVSIELYLVTRVGKLTRAQTEAMRLFRQVAKY